MTKQGWQTLADIGAPPNDIGTERWPDRGKPNLGDLIGDPRGAELDNRFLRDRMQQLVRELNLLRPPESQIFAVSVLTGSTANGELEILVQDESMFFEDAFENAPTDEPPWGEK